MVPGALGERKPPSAGKMPCGAALWVRRASQAPHSSWMWASDPSEGFLAWPFHPVTLSTLADRGTWSGPGSLCPSGSVGSSPQCAGQPGSSPFPGPHWT